ncbi:mCG140061, partial [Mus musculus]
IVRSRPARATVRDSASKPKQNRQTKMTTISTLRHESVILRILHKPYFFPPQCWEPSILIVRGTFQPVSHLFKCLQWNFHDFQSFWSCSLYSMALGCE